MDVKALEWYAQVGEPRLAHADGMVVVTIGDRTMLFPSEAAARFFHAAYFELPALAAENATLRAEIDEDALHAAKARILELEAEVAKLSKEKADLENRVTFEVLQRTDAVRRATVLAKALRQLRDKL